MTVCAFPRRSTTQDLERIIQVLEAEYQRLLDDPQAPDRESRLQLYRDEIAGYQALAAARQRDLTMTKMTRETARNAAMDMNVIEAFMGELSQFATADNVLENHHTALQLLTKIREWSTTAAAELEAAL